MRLCAFSRLPPRGRDALRKYAGGIFLAQAGSKLCLRPGPKAVAKRLRESAAWGECVKDLSLHREQVAVPLPPQREAREACANNAVTCYKSRMAGEQCSPLRGCAKFYLFCVIPSEARKPSRGISTEQRTRGRGVNTPNNYLPNVTLRATPFPQTMRLCAFFGSLCGGSSRVSG